MGIYRIYLVVSFYPSVLYSVLVSGWVVEMVGKEERKTDKQRIMDALNSMKPIRNKRVRKEFAEIYNKIYEICEG